MNEHTFAMVVLVFGCALSVSMVVMIKLKQELNRVNHYLQEELIAHEKTREHLRVAAARMRRENRERLMGIIEAQRT